MIKAPSFPIIHLVAVVALVASEGATILLVALQQAVVPLVA